MKIGFINDNFFALGYGGKELQLLAYYNYLRNYHDVVLIDPWNKNALDDIDIVHIFGSTKSLHNIIRSIRNNLPNVKIVLSPNFYSSNINFEKFVTSAFSSLALPNIYSYRDYIFKNSDYIITNSEAEKFQIKNIFNINDKKIHVVLNGIEDDFIDIKDNEKHSFLDKYSLEPGYFLGVSFLDERKNTLKMLKGFLETTLDHDKKLVLVGGMRFGSLSYANKVRDILSRNNHRIIHIEYIDRKKNIDLIKSAYYNCHAHLLPSILETPGISNIEANAFGKPIIVGECLPVKEYFGSSALYCDPNSISSIRYTLINSLLKANSNCHKGERKLTHAWSTVLTDLYRFYNNVLK